MAIASTSLIKKKNGREYLRIGSHQKPVPTNSFTSDWFSLSKYYILYIFVVFGANFSLVSGTYRLLGSIRDFFLVQFFH